MCVALALCTFALTLRAQTASAEIAYAVTETGSLVRFDTGAFGQANLGAITGLVGPGAILSLDFRPSTGRLYGITTNRLYIIDPATAVAQPVSAGPFATTITGNPDMDFDPVTGLIRVVTDTDQNMLIHPDTGAQTAVQTAISGATGISGIAFTNNFASPDRATLFGITHTTDRLVRIGGVNLLDGGASQAAGVSTAIGPLTVTTDQILGFDIAANDNEAFALLADAAPPVGLYKINLATGAATFVRNVNLFERLRGLALVTRAVTIYGLTSPTASAPGGAIITALSAVPGTLLPMPSGAPVTIDDLTPGEQVVAIDTRPATGELIGVTTIGRLLRINPVNGQTLFIAQVSIAFAGNVAGFDFNPSDDRLRITTDTGQNLSVVPDTGVATQETDLNIPGTVGIAYSATGTLYGIDESTNTFTVFPVPSTGGGAPVISMGTDVGPITGFDISAADGTGFAAITAPGGATTTLFAVSIPDGGTLPIADIGGGTTIRGLAVARPGRVRLPVATYSVLESAGSAPITLVREAGSSGPIQVKLTVAAGTAATPADFTGFTSIVEFADGEITKTINVVIANDPTDEPDETVTITLTQPFLGATLGTPSAATLTIVDNDPVSGSAPPTITITSPTVNPTYTESALFLTLSGTAADTGGGTVQTVNWVNDRGFSGIASIGASTASVEWFATDVQLAPGVNTIVVAATDNNGNLATDTIVVTVNDLSYYLAEGATGAFFDLDLLLANPNPTPVNVTATFLKPLGQGTVVRQYTLPATSRTTIDVELIPGLENAEVSTIVTASAATPIVVERTMRWNDTGYGAHTDKASPGTSTKWYFAEGSQGFFFTYLLLANPQNAANQVTVKYLRENVGTVTRQYDLAPLQRFTVDLGADAELVDTSFGMEVTFTLPGIAERAMYFGLNPLWIAGHESVGVTAPSRSWFLAEGATGTFFETFLLFANPGATPSSVAARYLPATGVPVDKTYPLPAGSRLTINVQNEDPSLANAAVATQVTSTVPIIVERAQYWPDPAPNWYEAHNSFGVTATGTRWGLAEGRVGTSAGYQTFILLANPNNNAVDVAIAFLREDGTSFVKNFIVQASSRFNVAAGGFDVPELANERFSAVITASHPIAVERAMYADLNGEIWQAGTNATATRLP